MPLIEVTAFERRFEDPEARKRLIVALTDALCEVIGEEARAETWVLLHGIQPDRWGFGGEVRS